MGTTGGLAAGGGNVNDNTAGATGLLRCEEHGFRGEDDDGNKKVPLIKGTCTKTPCTDPNFCPNDKYCDDVNAVVCSKQTTHHPRGMSTNSGVLIFKRSHCFKHKCSVFKVPAP